MISLAKITFKYINRRLCFIALLSSSLLFSQESREPQTTYTIADISVSGQTVYGAETIVTYSGLRKGETIDIPGDNKIGDAIKNYGTQTCLVASTYLSVKLKAQMCF